MRSYDLNGNSLLLNPIIKMKTEQTYSIVGKRCATFDEIMSQVEKIITYFNPVKIILFGSYAYGHPDPESDVDIFVIVNSNTSVQNLKTQIDLCLDHSFPIEVHVKSSKTVKKRLQQGDFFIRDILEKGQILYEQTGARMD